MAINKIIIFAEVEKTYLLILFLKDVTLTAVCSPFSLDWMVNVEGINFRPLVRSLNSVFEDGLLVNEFTSYSFSLLLSVVYLRLCISSASYKMMVKLRDKHRYSNLFAMFFLFYYTSTLLRVSVMWLRPWGSLTFSRTNLLQA